MADDEKKPVDSIQIEDESSDNEPEEYSVEAIRGKRKNPDTGITEYLIKWEGWPESDNSWEPIDNLKCPAIIAKFDEEEKLRKKARPASTRRPRRATQRPTTADDSISVGPSSTRSFLLEHEAIETGSNSTTTLESNNSIESQQHREPTWHEPKGFSRGVPIEEIVGSVVDDKGKLFFFVKWKNCPGMELVDAMEIEDKAPKRLCKWYRERLYYDIKITNPNG